MATTPFLENKVVYHIGSTRIAIPKEDLLSPWLNTNHADIDKYRVPEEVPPLVGQPWPRQGGIYLGIAPGPRGVNQHVVVCPEPVLDFERHQLSFFERHLDSFIYDAQGDFRIATISEIFLAAQQPLAMAAIRWGYWIWTSDTRNGTIGYVRVNHAGIPEEGPSTYECNYSNNRTEEFNCVYVRSFDV